MALAKLVIILTALACSLLPGNTLFELNETERKLFELIKNDPAQKRVVMQLDPRLCAIAREHCAAMNSGNFFAHLDPKTGKNANDRLADIGYPAPANYTAGQNFIESLARNAAATAATVAQAWKSSNDHRPHVYGQATQNGTEFYVNQILIGVGYVKRTGTSEGYYVFISSHPPVGQNWRIAADFKGPGLENSSGKLRLTGIPTEGVFTLEESGDGLGGGWETKAAGFAKADQEIIFSRPEKGQKFYRLRWTPE